MNGTVRYRRSPHRAERAHRYPDDQPVSRTNYPRVVSNVTSPEAIRLRTEPNTPSEESGRIQLSIRMGEI